MKEFNMDTMNEIMDTFLKEEDVQLLVSLPAGTFDAQIFDNMGNSPVVQAFIMLNAMSATFKNLFVALGVECEHKEDKEELINSLFDLVKKEVLNE